MAVNIIWSLTNGGASVTATDHGSVAAGAATSAKTLYLRHDGLNPIIGARIYLKPFVGTYTGELNPAQDFAEVVSWGDAVTAATFGGFLINMNATGSFPVAAWPTWSSKSPTGGAVVRTGVGNSSANAITLSVNTGCSSAGVIPVGNSPNVRFQCKVVVPTAESTVGARAVDMSLLYTYTS
jgi:hypothetical protein